MSSLDVGLGLRHQHYSHIIKNRPRLAFFEALSENYMGLTPALGGRQIEILQKIRGDYPVVFHGVSMSIGAAEPLDPRYMKRLLELANLIEPEWISDHLAWTGIAGENLHDLLPLPYTRESLNHVAAKVQAAQDLLRRPLALENPSTYLAFRHSEMSECEFMTELTRQTGCRLLLDINNVYVSSRNHDFDAREYIRNVPAESIVQIHLAGHSRQGELLIDTHDHPVPDPVWELYREAIAIWGARPTLIEWDDRIPAFDVLADEAGKARRILGEVR